MPFQNLQLNLLGWKLLLGGSPCCSPPCPVEAGRGGNEQERRCSLKISTLARNWSGIILMHSWALNKILETHIFSWRKCVSMGNIKRWYHFPSGWIKGVDRKKAGKEIPMQGDFQMSSQQYGIFWLAELSQVENISVLLSPLVSIQTHNCLLLSLSCRRWSQHLFSLSSNLSQSFTSIREDKYFQGIGEQGSPPGLPRRHPCLLDLRHRLAHPRQQHPWLQCLKLYFAWLRIILCLFC